MTNFEGHMKWGIVFHIIASVLTAGMFFSGVISPLFPFAVAVSLPLTLLGAAFPDIDHHASKPGKMFRLVVGIISTVLFAFVFGVFAGPVIEKLASNNGVPPEGASAVVVMLVAVLFGLLAKKGALVLKPKHRGMTHRVPIGVIVSLSVAGAFWFVGSITGFYPSVLSISAFSTFFSGFLSHITADGLILELKTYLSLS